MDPSDAWKLGAVATLITLIVVVFFTFFSVRLRKADPGGNAGTVQKRNILIGLDGNVSTSKFTLWLWLVLLAPGTAYLLVVSAVGRGTTLADIGLDPLRPAYLVLLGVPAAAAVAAQGIAATKATRGTRQRPPDRRGNVIRDDFGAVDLNDLQYIAFNVALLLFVGMSIVANSALPNLPDTLVGLTSVSAAGFVAGRAATSNPPTIVAVTAVDDGGVHRVTIRGTFLYGPRPLIESEPVPASLVSVGGVQVTEVDWVSDSLILVIVQQAPALGAAVNVTTVYGATATANVA